DTPLVESLWTAARSQAALGDRLEQLTARLGRWSEACIAAGWSRPGGGGSDLVEDHPAAALKVLVGELTAVAEVGQPPDLTEQVDERGVHARPRPLAGDVDVLRGTAVPGLQVEDRLEAVVRDAEELDLVAGRAHQLDGDAALAALRVLGDEALDDLAVEEAHRHLLQVVEPHRRVQGAPPQGEAL